MNCARGSKLLLTLGELTANLPASAIAPVKTRLILAPPSAGLFIAHKKPRAPGFNPCRGRVFVAPLDLYRSRSRPLNLTSCLNMLVYSSGSYAACVRMIRVAGQLEIAGLCHWMH